MLEASEAYLEAMRSGFGFAQAMGRRQCRPVDVLVGIAETDASLLPGSGKSLRDVAARMVAGGDGAGYPHMQAQEAAAAVGGRPRLLGGGRAHYRLGRLARQPVGWPAPPLVPATGSALLPE